MVVRRNIIEHIRALCRGLFWLICIGACLGASVDAQSDPDTVPKVRAAWTTAPVVIDGILEEDAWNTAGEVVLQQQNPHPGEPTDFMTDVRILRDTGHLYFGITCRDPDSEKIAVHTLQLDGDQTNDDGITIALDTFAQRKLAYVFQVNAAGAMADGLVSPGSAATNGSSGQGGVVNYFWNGYWQAAVRKGPDGWTAEIAIDTQSLQFDIHRDDWGLNISRYVPRHLLTLAWSGITLNGSVFNLQREGSLNGLAGLSQGAGLEFDPYVLEKYDDAKQGLGAKAGFDVKYNITPELAGLFTYNTDFSEAPAFAQQLSTSRFALFVPEQREFFLNGANIYDFGHNLGQNFLPFDSADIGLLDATLVPLNAGVKLIGTLGPWTLGVLDTQMGASAVSSDTNLFAGRASYNLDNEWRVGTLVTRGDPTGVTRNTFVGIDSTWSSSVFEGNKNLNLSGWLGRSAGDLPAGKTGGYGFDVEYPNDLWDTDFNYNYYGDALDPALGFLPRPGTKQYYAQVNYQPRPDPHGDLGWARQFFFDTNYTLVTDLDDHVQTELFNLYPFWFVTQTGWSSQIQLQSEYDFFATPFDIAPNVSVPAGSYRYPSWALVGNTPQSSQNSVTVLLSGGGLYGGKYKFWEIKYAGATTDAAISSQFKILNDYFYLPTGRFVERLLSENIDYAFTPTFSVSTLIQYNNVRKSTGINARLQWRITPDRYVYVIWNHGVTLSNNANAVALAAAERDNQVIFKVIWGFY